MKRRDADINAHQQASMASNPPRKKLRKAEGSGDPSGRSVHRRRKALSTLFGANPVVPFDVLLEILSNLDMKDLLNLSRTNKDVRRDLVSPHTVTLWRRKREETEAPPPPPGFSEAKWSSFLFTSHCYSCGIANSKVEPYLLKRICIKCRGKNYTEGWLGPAGVDSEMLKCVLYTKLHWKQHARRATHYRFVLSDDLSGLKSEWERLEGESMAGHPQAVVNFETFKQERARYITEVHSNAPQLSAWLEERQSKKWQENGVTRKQIGELIKQRFYQLGAFMQCDVDEAIDSAPGIRTGKEVKLTDTAWLKYKEGLKYKEALTPLIERQRDRRHDIIREDRMSQMDRRLQRWKASLSVSTREYLAYPVLSELYNCQEVASLRQLDCEIRLANEHYQPLIDAFPRLSADFIEDRKATVRSAIPTCDLRPDSPDTLELATSTFRLGERFSSEQDYTFEPGDVIVGWKALSVCHFFRYKTKEPLPCIFDQWISRISAGIVRTCGLDPRTASVDDMDRLDERFICTCHLKNIAASTSQDRPFGFETYTWRTALSHALVKHRSDSEQLGNGGEICFLPIGRLNITLLRSALDQQEALNRHEDAGCVHVWICNHCFPASADEPPRLLDRMLEHLRDSHSIAEPAIDDDYFLDEHSRKWWERPCKIDCRNGVLEHSEGVPPSGGFW